MSPALPGALVALFALGSEGGASASTGAGATEAPPATASPVSGADSPADAEVDDDADPGQEPEAPASQTIVARRRDARRVAGSAHVVDQETLERFEPDDVHRALRGVPGVYVRDEDGQGLRPNIGLRGASSDRSAKVALLEDGVLFAPAPYAAPAAYYFPLTARMVGIEVFKGPAAIRQGPHTVGGAINLRTRAAPMAPMALLDVGAGLVGLDRGLGRDQARIHAAVGTGDERWGVLLEGARVGSDGFKVIDGSPDASTGFLRDDVMLKARVGTGLLEDVRHGLELKLGFGREESSESYLGLTDADFAVDPFRRYAASALDQMTWTRTQGQLRYSLALGEALELDAVAYRHDLDRTWNKINGLRGAPNLHDVLTYPKAGASPLFMAQLLGEVPDALAGDPGGLLIGPNQRRYASQGVAVTARGRFVLDTPVAPLEQRIEFGVRLHQDHVQRRHSERAFRFTDAALVDVGAPEDVTAHNRAEATALAVHLVDELRMGSLTVVPGLRAEVIHGAFADLLGDSTRAQSDQLALLPGLGVSWQPLRQLVLLGGVHRGFSPIAPGQVGSVRPETSTNIEAGVRLDLKRELGLGGEAVGFFSRYDNILGECTYSSGCVLDVGSQSNGGAADVGGLELTLRHDLPLRGVEGARLRHEASYTFTRAVFLTSFVSGHPLFGRVNAGDEMAYVPTHQAAATSALVLGPLDVGLSMGLISAMRDAPGQGEARPEELTHTQAVVDATASFELLPGVRLALRVDNALDQRAIVSRRPFGARPGKPRSVLLSVEMETP